MSTETTQWATDYWGDILTEPTEAHARNVASWGAVRLYKREEGSIWELVAK